MINPLRGGWGFGAERRRRRMQRGRESVAVEKIEQTNSAKIFRAPQGGKDYDWPKDEPLTHGYG